MADIYLREYAVSKSTYVVPLTFRDAAGAAVVPDSVLWTLTDPDTGTVINSREDVSETPAAEIEVVLSGDDIDSADGRERKLAVAAVYDSDEGQNLPLLVNVRFWIGGTADDLVSIDEVKSFLQIGRGVAEKCRVVCLADTAGSLGGTYFLLDSPTIEYYVWIDVANGSADPAVSGRTGVEVDISSGDNAATIAAAIATALDALTTLSAVSSGSVAEITCSLDGQVDEAEDGDTGFAVHRMREGTYADEASDDDLYDLIEDVSRWFNAKTCRKLKDREHTLYFDGDGTDTLIVGEYPINSSVTELSLYVSTDEPRSWVDANKVDSDSIEIDTDNGIIYYIGDVFSEGRNTVKLVVEAGMGHDGAAIPYHVRRGVLEMCAFLWKRQQTGAIGMPSITSSGGGSVTMEVEREMSRFTESVINQESMC